MEIKEFEESWHSFVVPIPMRKGEDRNAYLFRCLDHLKQFYRNYSEFPRVNTTWSRWAVETEKNLEAILGVHNFCEMMLKGTRFCDVKYKAVADEEEGLPTGILVYSHVQEDKRKGVEFLKTLWKQFGYQEHLIEPPIPQQKPIYPD